MSSRHRWHQEPFAEVNSVVASKDDTFYAGFRLAIPGAAKGIVAMTGGRGNIHAADIGSHNLHASVLQTQP